PPRPSRGGLLCGWNWLRFWLALLVAVMAIVAPARLFDSPRPPLTQWFAFMVLYPLLSVLAPAQVYRRYLFQRFRAPNLSAGQIVCCSRRACGRSSRMKP